MKISTTYLYVTALLLSSSNGSAATIEYTLSGTTLNDAFIVGQAQPVPAPLPFTISLFLESSTSPLSDGRTYDVLPNDPRDRYIIGGNQAFYNGLQGYVQTSIDFDSGLRKLYISGDTTEDFGILKYSTGYQFVFLSNDFTADYTKPGVYTNDNANLNPSVSLNYSYIKTYVPSTGKIFYDGTYLHIDKLVITNSDYPTLSTVPLPASAPMFGAALLGLAGLGYAADRKKKAAVA